MNDQLLELSSQLPVGNIRDTIEVLIGQPIKDRPRVSVGLTNGCVLHGCFLGSNNGANPQQVSMVLEDETGRLSDNLAYLSLSHVVTLTVKAADRHLAVLSGGRFASPVREEDAPTRLAAKRLLSEADRQAQEQWKIALELNSETLLDSANVRANLEPVLAAVAAAIEGIAADDLGKQAIAAISRIAISAGDDLDVERQDERIEIQVNFAVPTSNDFGKTVLAKISSLL